MKIHGDIVGPITDINQIGKPGKIRKTNPDGPNLLDTHIWLWSTFEPHKLTSEVHRAITDLGNVCYLSAVSI